MSSQDQSEQCRNNAQEMDAVFATQGDDRAMSHCTTTKLCFNNNCKAGRHVSLLPTLFIFVDFGKSTAMIFLLIRLIEIK